MSLRLILALSVLGLCACVQSKASVPTVTPVTRMRASLDEDATASTIMPLVAIVPPIRSPAYHPFVTDAALPTWSMHTRLATTNNSLDPSSPAHVRGFPVCVRGDAVRYQTHFLETGEMYVTADVQLQRGLGNCHVMTGPFYYLIWDEGHASPGAEAEFYVVSSQGFAPPTACDHAGTCPLLSVSQHEIERALGGLKLGPEAPSTGAGAAAAVLATARRSALRHGVP